MVTESTPLTKENLDFLISNIKKVNAINPAYFERYGVKRGLRNSDGTGVMAGLTRVCSVDGYYLNDGELVPHEGHLFYRGYDMSEIVRSAQKERRFGYEEVVWLLIFGFLPNKEQLDTFMEILGKCRELPPGFSEDMIMKAPSKDIMNKLARSVLALYSYDDNPDDTSVDNVIRQSVQLIARLPAIMSYSYQVKRRHFYGKSMYIHPIKPWQSTAECILNSIRSDRKFTKDEALLLDTCLMMHAEHGGGNNSTFTTHVVSSSGTDTYSAIAAALGSLKGPKHGGANIKVCAMFNDIKENVRDWNDEEEISAYLKKILHKEAFDKAGLIYGVGHAVYSVSDPRAEVFKGFVKSLSEEKGLDREYALYSAVERLAPEIIAGERKMYKGVSVNVDFYSGFVYDMLGLPHELYTPLFAIARIAGWSAHRIEELLNAGKIIRPAYMSVQPHREYLSMDKR